jgi:peptide-methionine (S)-S-oxide reductase
MKTRPRFVLVASGLTALTTDRSAAFSSSAVPTTARAPSCALSPPASLALAMAVREATFGMGCFWEPAESLLKKDGVIATAVGYAGAPPGKPAPTYDAVCFGNDWVEAVKVAYDDEILSYSGLLDHFHECQKPKYTRQYASVIFANDDVEAKVARAWKEERRSGGGGGGGGGGGKPSYDESSSSSSSYDDVGIEPATAFYRAEEYHQRYWEKFRLRSAIGVALLAGESGVYNDFVARVAGTTNDAMLFGLSFDGLCGASFLAGAGWMLLERAVARDVRELKPGDLISAAAPPRGGVKSNSF